MMRDGGPLRHAPLSMPANAMRRAIRKHCRVLSVVTLLLLVPAVLWAHASLLRSVPARGAHVASPPVELRLTFSETPELAFTTLSLVDAAGAVVALAPTIFASDSRRTLVAPIRGPIRAGGYTVRWQVAGADGHPVRGQYMFTVAGSAPVAEVQHDPVTFPAGARGFGAESSGYVVLRWLQFTATLIVLGALSFATVIVGLAERAMPVPPSFSSGVTRGASRVGVWAAAALGLVTLVRLAAQSYALHGPVGLTDRSLLLGILQSTRWGWGWMVQMIGVVLAGWGLGRHVGHASVRTRAWFIAWIGGGLLALSLAMSGHAMSVPTRPALSVVADTLHVVASGAWMGSLLMVLIIGVPTARRHLGDAWPAAVAALVSGLHPVALGAVAVLSATGAYAAWLHVGHVDALWQTGYGRTLLVKLALVATAIAFGGYNARRVRPALVTMDGVRRFQRAAAIELMAGLGVLLITAVLVATQTAMDTGAMPTP